MNAHIYNVVFKIGVTKSLMWLLSSRRAFRSYCFWASTVFTFISYLSYGQCPSFTVSPSSGVVTCNGSSATFTASGGSGYGWYNSPPFESANLVGSGNTFTPSSSGSYYLVGQGCGTQQVRPISILISTTPAAPVISGIAIPFNSSVVLKPTTSLSSGENFNWYASNQTTQLSQSAEFYTGSLTANTTYYVSKTKDFCESSKTSFVVTTNALPIASAGADISITLPLSSRNIVGSGSDGGSPVTFQWSKISGPSVTMNGTTSTTLALTNITAGSYVFRLAVTDNIGQKVVDDMVFQANPSTPTNNYNYTRQETILVSGVTSQSGVASLVVGQKSGTTSYLDELGRPMESIGWQITPGKFDAISPVVYDNLGREAKRYLPEVSTTIGDGLYKKVLDVNGEYSGGQGLYPGEKPYAVTLFDSSPLSRPVESGSPGLSWQPGSTSGTTKATYGANVAGDVRIWTINSGTGLPQSSTTWAANMLALNTTTNYVSDTKQTVMQVYTDAQGLKLVTRTKVDASNWAETHYVYDTRNNLRFIIPPQLYKDLKTAGNYNPTLDQVNRYCFQYLYDEQHRVISTKSPGVDWEYAVYDIRGRVVLTQDGNQRIKNEWGYVEYDAYDRETVMGIYRPQSSNWTRAYFQSVYDGTVSLPATTSTVLTGVSIVRNTKGTYQEYIASSSITLQPGFVATASSGHFKAWIYSLLQPGQVLTSGTTEPLVYTYYDSYSGSTFFQDANFAFQSQTWDALPLPAPGDPVADTYAKFDRVRGQVTGKTVKVLGTDQWLNTVMYYDQSQRPIQTVSSTHLGGVSRSSTLYDFSGKVLQSKQSELGQTTLRQLKYDHAGRILKVYHQLNSQPKVILSEFVYDELSRIRDKKLHSMDISATTPAYLQSVDYAYNIKGWITGNNTSGSAGETDYFEYGVSYESDDFGAGITNNVRKDGMQTSVRWRNNFSTRQKMYTYDYDNLNQLSSATFKAGTTSQWTASVDVYSEKGLTYDYNGNIQTLQRTKRTGASTSELMDNLSYDYGVSKGNQLMKVTELSATASRDLGFKDGNTVGDDYAYDVNGNLTIDNNKGITSIVYNFMNLPERVTFSDGTYMQYVYAATGEKLKQTYFNSGGQPQIKTDYVGDQLLVNDLPVVIFHEEGRLLPPDNTNRILNREANGREGFTANQSVTLSSVYQNSQTYVKVVSTQASGNPGVFIDIASSYTVRPGERYQFKVLGYRETAQNAKLYVKHSSGDIIWSTGTLLPQGVANETWSTNEFIIPAGVTQVTVGVRWDNPANNAVNGATMYINQAALYKMDWEYQYFLGRPGW